MRKQRGQYSLVTDRREMKALPAEDFFTGSIKDEVYIDTDKDTDYGRIYIGKKTFEDFAALFDFVPADLAQTQAVLISRLESEVRDLRSALNLTANAAAELLRLANAQAPSDNPEESKRDSDRELESIQRTLRPSTEPADESGLE